jgi:hypothetical protein
MFSRNASSSRAIPVAKMIEDLRRDPAMPVYWGSNKPGMQAGEELSKTDRCSAKIIWLQAMDGAIKEVERLVKFGLHKQIANRILEPWAHINVVVTATDYENFFALRCHEDAQPEIKMLADQMRQLLSEATPVLLQPGEWHLPYYRPEEDDEGIHAYIAAQPAEDTDNISRPSILELQRRVSVARCARVSYLTHDGRPTSVDEDLALFERLLGSQPLHASPAEHQATPDEPLYGFSINEPQIAGWENQYLHGNLNGWIQYRKTLEGEFVAG